MVCSDGVLKVRAHLRAPSLICNCAAVQPGQRCAYTSQCHAIYPGMICETGVCRCGNGQYWTGSRCDTACPGGYIVNANTGLCRPGCVAQQIEYQGECLSESGVPRCAQHSGADLAQPTQPCSIDAQCTGGSMCVTAICTCPRGSANQAGVCRQSQCAQVNIHHFYCAGESAPGQSCADGQRCVGGAQCNNAQANARCMCTQGAVVVNGQCILPTTGRHFSLANYGVDHY